MDYDRTSIAGVYDQARGLAPDVLQHWLDLVARDAGPAPGALIVDVGCGTGRFSAALARYFAARVLAVDPSAEMLAVARSKTQSDHVEFRQTAADALPLAPGAADMAFLSMVLHHLGDPGAAVRELRRVLKAGGRVCVRTVTRDGEFPHKHFFPGTDAGLPTRAMVEHVFAAEGFAKVAHEIVTQAIAPSWPAYVDKVALRGYSTLARLSGEAFAAGMVALRAHIPADGPSREITEDVDWWVFEVG